MIFFDADALITFLRGNPNMAAFMAKYRSERFAIPSPVLFEVYYGVFFPPLSKRFSADKQFLKKIAQEHKKLVQLLNDINVFDLTVHSIERSAKISAELDAKGQHIGEFDSLIAGIILEHGYEKIATNNTRHYEHVAGLTNLNY